MLVVCLVESGAAVSEAGALSVCADVRARLDEAGAAPSSTLHVSSDPRAGFRKLKQAVHMGHGEVEEAARRMNEISIMGGLQAELSRQQREQADRLEAAMARNQVRPRPGVVRHAVFRMYVSPRAILFSG